MSGSGLASVEDARAAVLAATGDPLEAEPVATADAFRRVLAEPVLSSTDLPPWDNSAMDGYAIRSLDVQGASEDHPARLGVVGQVAAGQQPDSMVAVRTAVRIATGAPLPPGADAVVPVEATTPIDESGAPTGSRGRDATGPLPAAILVHEAVPIGGSVRRRGDDLAAGATLLEPGRELDPAAIAISAGAGVAVVSAYRRPRVAILATGDEVRPAGDDLGPAGIPDANGPGLAALVADAGGDPIRLGVAADLLDDVTGRLRSALPDADAIIVSGGVSVGPYDVVKAAFDAIGTIDLWRVAVQPGKPFAFGVAPRGGRRPTLLFGLPGNPVSSFVTFELFVRPAIRRLAGYVHLYRPVDRCVLDSGAGKSDGRRTFLRVTARRDASGLPVRDPDGRVLATLAGGQGSHVLSALARADALAVIPEAAARAEPGVEYPLWWLER